VRTSASAGQIWSVLGEPGRWPEHELFLRRVIGSSGTVHPGEHLLGVGRGLGVRIPLDVVEAVTDRRLVVRVHAAPGIVEELTYELTPLVRGGCDLAVSVVVEGLFARGAALPLWLASGLTVRVLAHRVEGIARAARKVA